MPVAFDRQSSACRCESFLRPMAALVRNHQLRMVSYSPAIGPLDTGVFWACWWESHYIRVYHRRAVGGWADACGGSLSIVFVTVAAIRARKEQRMTQDARWRYRRQSKS